MILSYRRVVCAAGLMAVLAWCVSSRLAARESPLWGDLEPGPYAVGFKTLERYDHARVARYKRGADGSPRRGERGRPVQVCVWYPARDPEEASTVVYGEYVFPNPADVRFFNLLSKLQAREIHDRVLPALRGDGQVMLELLNMKLSAVRDALHREGSFPFIIYIPGASSGIAENVVLCEYLASHGFIVAATPSVGSSLLYADSNELDLETIVRDAEFIRASLRDWPYLDFERLGVIGYGMGGAAALILQMRNTDVDAVVSLAGIHMESEHAGLLEGCLHYDPARVGVPLLHVCRDDSGTVEFGTPERFRFADRYLLALSGMENLHFTSYGAVSAMVPDTTGPAPGTKRLAYETVCRYVERFAGAHLHGDDDARRFVDRAPRENGIAAGFITYRLKRGEKMPPTEDRFFEVVTEDGAAEARKLLEDAARSGHGSPFRQEMMNRIGVLYARMGEVDEGTEILRVNTEAHPHSASAWLSIAFMYMYTRRPALAVEAFRTVLELLPDDTTLSEEERTGFREAATRSLERLEARMGEE
jgi:pimeloyl-ACP methyl ester carboxylesterase